MKTYEVHYLIDHPCALFGFSRDSGSCRLIPSHLDLLLIRDKSYHVEAPHDAVHLLLRVQTPDGGHGVP